MSFTITFKNTKKFEKFLSPRHFKILEVEVRKATADNLILVQDSIIRRILSRGFGKKANSPLTLALKDTNVPLVDSGDMAKAIEVELQSSFTGTVGFLRDQKSSHGMKISTVVKGLEEGFTVKLTGPMRRLLFLKMRRAGIPENPPGVTSSRGKSSDLRIPPRPFITPVFNSKFTRAKIQKNWKDAVKRAYRKMGAL